MLALTQRMWNYIRRNPVFTIRDIAMVCDANVQTVYYYVRKLTKMGYTRQEKKTQKGVKNQFYTLIKDTGYIVPRVFTGVDRNIAPKQPKVVQENGEVWMDIPSAAKALGMKEKTLYARAEQYADNKEYVRRNKRSLLINVSYLAKRKSPAWRTPGELAKLQEEINSLLQKGITKTQIAEKAGLTIGNFCGIMQRSMKKDSYTKIMSAVTALKEEPNDD
jgi:DNA-binding CsgD family transcriptional regulator